MNSMTKNKKSLITTAVLSASGYFTHFGITPISAILYGNKPNEIINVEIEELNDQSMPPPPQKDTNPEPDYWAWFDYEADRFSTGLIWYKRFLLDMCFPYGIKGAENANKGKAYRVKVRQQ